MAITFGNTAPSQITVNMDALFATSLANYKKTLTDNVSASNALFYELKKKGYFEMRDGGAYIAEDLLYELGQFDAYDGYDELGDIPTDGITQVQFQWRQGAVPIMYSEKERKQNKHRLVDLVKSKIKQAEMGFIEGFNKALLLGALAPGQSGTSLTSPFVSPMNGAQFIDPLPLLIKFNPATGSVGNIDPASYTWWRNRTKTAAATTMSGFLSELDNLMNTCSIGPGGKPTLGICDQTTYELWNAAYYLKYRTQTKTDESYPFENIMFRGAHITWEENIGDAYSDVANTTTYGTAYFIHPEFFRVYVESETNFSKTEFVKPPKGDSRIAHILFMGQTGMNNRRKHGVYGKIPRTLTAS